MGDDAKNVEAWGRFWGKSVNAGEHRLDETTMTKKWNSRSQTYGKTRDPKMREKRLEKLFSFLEKNGFSPRGAKILDIGCGTGALALPLADMGADVTAMDISSGMLQELRRKVAEKKAGIRVVEGSWWSADIDALGFRGQFDLVLASRTPAIRDPETLQRMMDCSRAFCMYIGFLKKPGSSAHSEISRTILHEEYSRNVTSMIFPFMHLYLSGYRPETMMIYNERKEQLPWEDAAERAIDFLANERHFSEETREKIRDYFRKDAVDGIYTSKNDMGEGTLFWEV